MIGAMPDYQATLAQYQDLQQQRQRGSARHRQCAGASESVCARWAGIARGLCSAPLTGGNFGSATVWRTVAECCADAGSAEF